jgi:putative ABC transport system permease protein
VPYLEFDLNFRIFAWGIALAGLFGVISGVYPAWRMSRMHPVHALRGGAQ